MLFPNLPFLIDGETKVTETPAIAQYMIYKAKRDEMLGKIPVDQVTYAQVLGFLDDLTGELQKIYYAHNNQEAVQPLNELREKNLPKLRSLETLIGGRPFVLHYVSYLDFRMYYLFDMINHMVNKAPGATEWFGEFTYIR